MVPRPGRVRRRSRETANVWTLELEPDGDGAEPGQFHMLYAMGVGEVPISVSGTSRDGGMVHTIRDAGAVSRALAGLRPGAGLGVRGPFGTGWPLAEAEGRDVVVMAGGIGLAPLRPVLRRLTGRGGKARRVALLYGARSPADLLYPRELDRWRARGAIVEVTVDHAVGGWDGKVGVVTALLGPGLFEPSRSLAMICGPEVMMRFSVAALMDLGMPAASIYVSLERNMKCAVGHCGHCQLGGTFVCRDGPVFRYDRAAPLLGVREL
ncbi:MAG: Ni/Fe hydrogenase subunit gamma [Alphaproteobacteria bacterium]|nr:Ni/Fe hydrogenase subunit gamma [Alphaproteobacteria bacterium]